MYALCRFLVSIRDFQDYPTVAAGFRIVGGSNDFKYKSVFCIFDISTTPFRFFRVLEVHINTGHVAIDFKFSHLAFKPH